MQDRFVVGYSGNLGRAHELGILLDAADRLRHRLEIVFLIIGEGNQKENLQAEVTRRGLADVLFKPYRGGVYAVDRDGEVAGGVGGSAGVIRD